jgi:hypothetical protein
MLPWVKNQIKDERQYATPECPLTPLQYPTGNNLKLENS